MKVYKYPLELIPEQNIQIPFGSKILTVQTQYEDARIVCLWALVDPERKPVERTIIIRGTGHELKEEVKYIGTVQHAEGTLVWHIFEKI